MDIHPLGYNKQQHKIWSPNGSGIHLRVKNSNLSNNMCTII